jgi:hypothetical protein
MTRFTYISIDNDIKSDDLKFDVTIEMSVIRNQLGPTLVVVACILKDMKLCSFSLTMSPFKEDPAEDAPTEIFIPGYFFQD